MLTLFKFLNSNPGESVRWALGSRRMSGTTSQPAQWLGLRGATLRLRALPVGSQGSGPGLFAFRTCQTYRPAGEIILKNTHAPRSILLPIVPHGEKHSLHAGSPQAASLFFLARHLSLCAPALCTVRLHTACTINDCIF